MTGVKIGTGEGSGFEDSYPMNDVGRNLDSGVEIGRSRVFREHYGDMFVSLHPGWSPEGHRWVTQRSRFYASNDYRHDESDDD